MKYLIILIFFSTSQTAYAFLDSIFNKASSVTAVASGADDLITELDEGASILKDVKNISDTANDVRDVLTEVDSSVYDIKYISSSIYQSEELANSMHIAADKTRRIKRISKRLGLIAIDAPSAGAMEQIRTNTILDSYVADRKEQDLNAKEDKLKRITFIAKREKQSERELTQSLLRNKERDKKSGISFHPFPIPDGKAAVDDRIMTSIYFVPSLGF